MINGMILNQSIYNENSIDSIDFEIGLALENMMLKQQLALINEEEYLTEGWSIKNQYKPFVNLKYALGKWKSKERTLKEIDKDIEKCDKTIKKLSETIDKYDKSPKTMKSLMNFITIFNQLMMGMLTTSYWHSYSKGLGVIDRKEAVGTLPMKNAKELDSIWEFYKADLILCKKETETTKKFLIELKKKKQKEK